MDPRSVLALISVLGGCASPPVIVETQRVEVPIAVRAVPPEEFRRFEPSTTPEFVSVGTPGARASLTAEGIRQYQTMLFELTVRIREWEAWAFDDQEAP